jgi:hypothetical protein
MVNEMLELTFFGEKAKEIAKDLGLTRPGQETDVNTKIHFKYKSVEGHPVFEITFDTVSLAREHELSKALTSSYTLRRN